MRPGLQEWIHSIEEGAGAKYLKVIALILGLVALAVLYNIRELPLFSRPEAMDAAQLGRNLARGEGFSTKFVRPLSIAMIEGVRGEHQGALKENHPDLANPPFYPLLLAGVMKVVPMNWDIQIGQPFQRYQPELIITILNQVLFLASLILVYRLGRKLFEPIVGWVAAIIFALSEAMWRFSSSGLPTMLLILFVLLIAWALLRIEEPGRAEPPVQGASAILWGAFVGLILALGCLTRYSFGWLFIPVAIWMAVFGGPKRGAALVAATLVFVALLTPWIIRNYQVSHTLFGTAGFSIHQDTPSQQGFYLERSMPKNVQRDLNQIPLESYAKKGLSNLGEIVRKDLPALGGNWITGLFLAGLLVPFRNPAISRLRWLLIGFLFTLVITQALAKTPWTKDAGEIHGENLIVFVAPLVCIFGVAFFFLLLDQIEFPVAQLRTLAIAAFIFLMSLPMILMLMPPRQPAVQYPPYYPPMIQEASYYMKTNELMMSDMPWAVAWYGNRKCVWITLDAGTGQASDFYRIHDFQKPIQGLYLTPLTTDSRFVTGILRGQEGAWSRFMLDSLIKTNVPKGFPLQSSPIGYMPEQMFLSDHPRWRTSTR